MRYVATLSILMLSICASSVASADELGVELDMGTVYTSDQAYDLFDDNDYYGDFGAGLSYSTERLIPEIELLALYERSLGAARSESRFSGALQTRWIQRRFMVGADYGPTFFGFLRPSARVGAGWAMQTLRVNTTGAQLKDRAHDLVAFGALGLGARFRVPTDPSSRVRSVTFGVETHYGYMYQTEATFDQLRADRDAYDEDDPWTRQDVSLGGVDTGGLFWDLGLSLRLGF
ncbi:unnamed protein product [Laminaria digitata]